MQVTLNIPNEQLSEKILWFLEHFKSEGLEIMKGRKETSPSIPKHKKEGLDFSSIDVPSFKGVDGMEYQRSIREKMEHIFSENSVRAFQEIKDPVAWQRNLRDEWERDDSA